MFTFKTRENTRYLRPLLLLESLFKIQTRIISDRLLQVMDEISYPDKKGGGGDW